MATLIPLVLIAIGLLIGAKTDIHPERPLAMRAGYRVLEADFHSHTRFSDGLLSPFDLVLQAKRRGLDVLAVTEHNNLFPAKLARWFSHRIGGPTIILGEEVTTKRYHLIGVGLTERLDASAPLDRVLDDIHRQGGIAIAAHPVKGFQPAFLASLDRIDAAEVMHPLAYGASNPEWSWTSMRAFFVDAPARGHALTAIGSSDYHFMSVLGICRTLVFAENDSEAAVMDALRNGRTVVVDLQGRMYGDLELTNALAKDPYVPRTSDYGYEGASRVDRFGRVLAWLGVMGLISFGRRKS